MDKELKAFCKQHNLIEGDLDTTIALLFEALERSIATYEYASMTPYERDACQEDMRFSEKVRDYYEHCIAIKIEPNS